MGRPHLFKTLVTWTGNSGEGTSGYRSYERSFLLTAGQKPAISGSADPAFRGDRARWNPEELLVGSLSACHQLWFLHLCSEAGIVVEEYEDAAEGVMEAEADGTGRFTQVTLRPKVSVAQGTDLTLMEALHARAHERCLIAQSVTFAVRCEPTVSYAGPAEP